MPRRSLLPHRPHRRLRSALAWLCLSALPTVATAAETKTSFQDDVRPIFEAACNNCHNPDKKKGGLDLSSFAALMAGGSSGEIAVPGDPGGSRLYACVTKAAEPFMPPQGDGLTPPQLDILKKWIEGGLLDTRDGVARKSKKPAFSAQLANVTLGKPEGPPPVPENPLLEPVVTTRRAAATAALAASPWAPIVALSAQRQVLLYHTDTLELAGVLPCPDGAVDSLIFSRNGRLVIAGTGIGGKSGKVIAWDVTTGQRAFEVGEERDSVLAADLSADQAIVALGGPSRRVKLYATADGSLLKDIKKHTDWVTALQFSPDGVLLATGDRAGGLQVWEGRSGNDYLTLPGHTAAITAVSWRADGNILASASEDGTIRLWEMNEGKEVKKWDAHPGGVQSMNFTHDGRLVSCGRDRHFKVWKADGTQAAAQNAFADLTMAACFSHDGARVIVGDWSGRVSVWNATDATAIGEMSAAPPSIDQRLASLIPARDEARAAAESAATTAAAAQAHATTARAAMDAAHQTLNTFSEHLRPLEHALATARAAAEAMLDRLSRPESDPSPAAAPTLDQTPAVALATDVSSVRTTLDPSHEALRAALSRFAPSVADQLATTRARAAAMLAATTEAEAQSAAATTAHQAAATALADHQRAVARWQAAKINTTIFQKRGELFALTTKLEDISATITSVQGQADGSVDTLNEQLSAKSAIESEVAALQQAIEAESARYLATVPQD